MSYNIKNIVGCAFYRAGICLYEIGQRTSCMLIRLIEGETLEDRHVILTPQLIVRESCGAKVQ